MKVIILGDSISEGIGSKKVNYCKILESRLPNLNFSNLALTGTTITYCQTIMKDVLDIKPDIVIMFYGNVDALPRVKENTFVYKCIPKRYKGLGMMDPRALYTSRKKKRFIQKIDSFIRYKMKNTIIKYQGYTQWTPAKEFKEKYDQILSIFKKNGINVITISNVPISEKYFNHANLEYKNYNHIIEGLSNKYEYEYINLYKELSGYKLNEVFLHDLYHPNKYGYEIISDLITEKILKLI